MCGLLCTFSVAYAHQKGGEVNSATIAAAAGLHAVEYMQTKVIGVCGWLLCVGPICKVDVTNELDQYLPDLVVTVHSKPDNNPWLELQATTDKASYLLGNKLMQTYIGSVYGLKGVDLADGGTIANAGGSNRSGYTQKSVEVTGSPMSLMNIPYAMLRSDTTPLMPYYSSALDAVPSRSGIAEMLRWESYLPIGPYIGNSMLDHWGYMYPRDMAVNQNNPYKAAVIAAMHASALVTNTATLHMVVPTNHSCGLNCSVANVKAETGELNQKWQEVYPVDRHVIPGQSDVLSPTPIGGTDAAMADGNFVFLLWRHYRGCVQGKGTLIFYTVPVPPTKKD